MSTDDAPRVCVERRDTPAIQSRGVHSLAVRGGEPVRRDRRWPVWPEIDAATEASLLGALRSLRWSLTRPSAGIPSYERRFAEAFAEYNGSRHCVSVDHGSSALVIALEALDLGPGDEVIVPVLTWVAPATAVLRVGARPILADVDPRSGCLTAESVLAQVTTRTRAVIVVHLACSVAELDEIVSAAKAAGLAIIEDCSQSHGATWNGRRVGTLGDIGVFSLGAAKTLAGGEGGAVITDDLKLYDRFQMLRADSRRYPRHSVERGQNELVEDGRIMGANYCMSELTAAVLLDQLTRLDRQNAMRALRADELSELLENLHLFERVPLPVGVGRRAVYEFAVQIKPDTLAGNTIDFFAEAVSRELGMAVYPPRSPLNRSVLLRPLTKKRFQGIWQSLVAEGRIADHYPGGDYYRGHTVHFHHSALLGTAEDVHDIASAFTKVARAFADSDGDAE